jgi:hypothetical protein
MKTFPTLYKLDASGSVREWTIQVDGSQVHPRYTVIHGLKDGQLQETSTEIKSGKNFGKANETSSYEQAISEATSLWMKQRDRKGYSENIPTTKQLRPMLAKSYNEPDDFDKLKDGKHIKYPCFGQPKLDGCISGETLINTKEYGYKTVKWLVDNKIECKVLSFNTKTQKQEYKSISYHFLNKEISEQTEWFEIELESGEKLTITGDHEIYLPELKCWRRADELTGNEKLMVI